ncbi:MAG TPA: hypothetical protein VIC55_01080, partial [Gemmatimonadaceae bacterium]
MRLITYLAAAALALAPAAARAQHLLVPMDDDQTNHLKAYGLTYNALKDGARGEWLLNYRGGSFLLPDTPELRRRAALDGITAQPVDDAALADIRTQMSGANMESIPLEKAPRIAVYTAPYSPPWDDAVILALRYAGIPYTPIWDEEIEHGDLAKYDWVHLFHEDFTGQLGKFYINYSGAPWFVDMQRTNLATARKLGFANIPALKKDVAEKVREYVSNGGFLFAMCGATETLELAIAAQHVDIASVFADGTPMDPDADAKLDWSHTLAFRDARLEMSPYVNAMSDIDGHQANVPGRRQPLGTFTLFAFSAKFDPVPSMLVQDHRSVIPDFYGVTTSFMRNRLKPGVTVLAD